jgi:hypothetical protein
LRFYRDDDGGYWIQFEGDEDRIHNIDEKHRSIGAQWFIDEVERTYGLVELDG